MMRNESRDEQRELKFLFNEQFFTLHELEANPRFAKLEAPAMVYSTDVPYAHVVHVFEDHVILRKWAANTKLAELIDRTLGQMDEARKLENEDHDIAKEKIQKKAKRIVAELEALSERSGLPIDSPRLQRLATVGAPLIEGPVFDPALLFTEINYRGGVVPLWHGLWLPHLGWLGRNDQISSAHVWGLMVLCEHSWWRGRSLWLSGADLEARNLGWFGFNDRASSVIHF